jgi:hypothetical protein
VFREIIKKEVKRETHVSYVTNLLVSRGVEIENFCQVLYHPQVWRNYETDEERVVSDLILHL